MTENDVMVIFDTKGDFRSAFFKPGDVIISNDSMTTGKHGLDYWNIFSEVDQGNLLEEDLIEIARTLFAERAERSNQPFFPNAARDLFTATLLHFMRGGKQEELNNASLRNFFNRVTAPILRSALTTHEDLAAICSYISEDKSPQTQGVMAELQQMVREILVGNFKQNGTLSMRKLIRAKGRQVVFVEYDLGIGNTLTPIYRLLLDLAIKEAISRRKSEGNVWFVIDEFRLVPHLQHIDDGVNYGRSLGVKFIIGVQNVEYLYHIYGEALARSILSGFRTTVAFNVGDAATRTYIQGLFGKNRKLEKLTSTIPGKPVIEQVREANVVEDWDIASLSIGRAIVGMSEQNPFLFQFKQFQ
jgi:type IV secretory pathway TraG/TraD family ATPase VirD4